MNETGNRFPYSHLLIGQISASKSAKNSPSRSARESRRIPREACRHRRDCSRLSTPLERKHRPAGQIGPVQRPVRIRRRWQGCNCTEHRSNRVNHRGHTGLSRSNRSRCSSRRAAKRCRCARSGGCGHRMFRSGGKRDRVRIAQLVPRPAHVDVHHADATHTRKHDGVRTRKPSAATLLRR